MPPFRKDAQRNSEEILDAPDSRSEYGALASRALTLVVDSIATSGSS
jgi:hypothetical protein